MTLALKIVIASAIFCVLALVFVAMLKKKIVTITLFVLTGFFLLAATFYAYIEYSAYQKRVERYANRGSDMVVELDEKPQSELELSTLKYFQEYRNSLNGYEVFLLEIGMNHMDQDSYQNTIRDQIMANLENEEYGETYWNTVFNIAFEYDGNIKKYHRPNYNALYVIPADYEYSNLEGDYGDLNVPENYAYFERMCQLLYMSQKAKLFDRSAENITNLWKQNKSYIYTFFSKSKYDELCKQVVDDLIEIHDTIIATPNYDKFYKMYDVSDDAFLEFPSLEYTSSFEYSWPFSFWDRRFTENNASEVYAILNEIQNHYKD
ncbi:MAG: hypothetical protein GYB37_05030 [Algicola sp.]|nr:hypothetical protein [Algicola sp.]